jgi:peptidoglycan/LPS O-acetylase OafA/YrhL
MSAPVPAIGAPSRPALAGFGKAAALGALAITVLSITLVIGLAEGSWQWIESPLIRGGHRKFRYLARAPEASSSGSLLGRPFVSENPIVRIIPD